MIFDQNCQECPKALFLKILAFFFFILLKIHVSIWLSFFVSLASAVLMLLGTKEGRIFFSFQNLKKKKDIFSLPHLYGKREELESCGLRHSKEEIKSLNKITFKSWSDYLYGLQTGRLPLYVNVGLNHKGLTQAPVVPLCGIWSDNMSTQRGRHISLFIQTKRLTWAVKINVYMHLVIQLSLVLIHIMAQNNSTINLLTIYIINDQ